MCLRWNNSQRFINLSLTWVMASYGLYIPFNHLVTYITLFIGLNLHFWCSIPTQTPRSRITANIAKIDPHCIPRYVGKWQDYLYMFYLLYIYIYYIYIYMCVCVCVPTFGVYHPPLKAYEILLDHLNHSDHNVDSQSPPRQALWRRMWLWVLLGPGRRGTTCSATRHEEIHGQQRRMYVLPLISTHTQTHIYGKGIYMRGGRARLRGPGGSMKHQFHPYI